MVASSIRPAPESALPRHVAIIMDGNGRWAEQNGLPRTAGHEGGIEPVRETIRAAAEAGIRTLTLFAFSSENFLRPADEVDALMALLLESLECEIAELDAEGVRLRFIGNRELLGPALVAAMDAAEARTRSNAGLDLVIAVAYGGHWDLAGAARRLASQVRAGELAPEAIDEARFAAELATAGLPPVDLLIRTGGEQRISNFLLWDLAYAELYFSPLLWPDFSRAELERALETFASRRRRFGRAGWQLEQTAC